MFDDDEIPVAHLFRSFSQMPRLEQEALKLASGRVLDVGAGSGCHSIALRQLNNPAVSSLSAIDISPLSCQTMTERGLTDVRCVNMFDPAFDGEFDTILLLMNGTGVVGTLDNLPAFFGRLAQLLAPDGQVLIDSSDLKYLFEDENGMLDLEGVEGYYGEVDYQMKYKGIKGAPFDWLYVDFDTLSNHASANGFSCEKIMDGEHYDYLARLRKR